MSLCLCSFLCDSMSSLNSLDSLLDSLKNIIYCLEKNSQLIFRDIANIWDKIRYRLEVLVPDEHINIFDEVDMTIKDIMATTAENFECRITCIQANVPVLIQILEGSFKDN